MNRPGQPIPGMVVICIIFILIIGSNQAKAQAEFVPIGQAGILGKFGYGGFEDRRGIRLDLAVATKPAVSFGFFYDLFVGENGSGSALGFDGEYLIVKQRTTGGIAMAGIGSRMQSASRKYSGFYYSSSTTSDDLILYGIGSLNLGQPDKTSLSIALRPGLLLSSDAGESPLWGGLDLNMCTTDSNRKIVIGGGVSGRSRLYEVHIGMGIFFNIT